MQVFTGVYTLGPTSPIFPCLLHRFIMSAVIFMSVRVSVISVALCLKSGLQYHII